MKSYPLLLTFVLLLVLSCKNDPKETTSTGHNDTSGISGTKINSHAERMAKRKQDSLNMAQKMIASGREVDPAYITQELNSIDIQKTQDNTPTHINGIPVVCKLLTEQEISEAIDVHVMQIKETSGSKVGNNSATSQSCFWRWNAGGMLIQVETNPLPEEIPNWVTKFIDTKMNSGESDYVNKGAVYRYTNFKGPGDRNIMNEETGRYYMSKGEKYVVSVIFNGKMNNKERVIKNLGTKIFEKL